jgi:hypothetical protein
MFNPETVDSAITSLKTINAPFVQISKSELGGKEYVSIIIKVSLQPKGQWTIFQNSNYFLLHFFQNGTMEMFSGWVKKNFRKTKAKSIDDAVNKVNKYIAELNQLGMK